ncbi:FliI/YscN family ATPase [Candidatus Poribacteria bacterium]|nr:FliI/YscN family ATPase [Candidatus Poribacteria bacterium]
MRGLSMYFDGAPLDTIRAGGRIVQSVGLTLEAVGLNAAMGDLCYVFPLRHQTPALSDILARSPRRPSELFVAQGAIWVQVVGFREDRVILMPLGDIEGVRPGDLVLSSGASFRAPVGKNLLGRVLNALGEPIDGKGPVHVEGWRPIYAEPPDAMRRGIIEEPIATGIRAMDTLLTVGRGQRMGIFSGSGVGKSILMGMVARNTEADVSVVALIGERGREVPQFLKEDLGEEGLARSVVVVVTSDQPALLRLQGAYLATAIAEYFRDNGNQVMFMMDSVTRFAMALREVGLASGEPPTTRGYPPSMYGRLPKLLERAGPSAESDGSITGFYTVLVEGDDLNEPVADTMRSLLDGHIVLSRDLANRGHYPAIDVPRSISRLMIQVTDAAHQAAAQRAKTLLTTHRDAEDLIQIGAYVPGSNPDVDFAIEHLDDVNEFLRQSIGEHVTYQEAQRQLLSLLPPQPDR